MFLGLGIAFMISIVWEIFELSIGAISAPLHKYVLDTWLDVTFDMMGAGTALLYFFKSK